MTYLTAYEIRKGLVERGNAEESAKQNAPEADFVFKGMGKKYIYFNIVAKRNDITNREITDLKEKTRFELISEINDLIYLGKFRMEIMK